MFSRRVCNGFSPVRLLYRSIAYRSNTFRPFEPLTPSQTQSLIKCSSPVINNNNNLGAKTEQLAPTAVAADCIVLSHLDNSPYNILDAPAIQYNWNSVNKQKKETTDDMSLESTKRKRQRKMNKHKHRKALRKMKFTLRKHGR